MADFSKLGVVGMHRQWLRRGMNNRIRVASHDGASRGLVLLLVLLGLGLASSTVAQTPSPIEQRQARLSDPVYMCWIATDKVSRCVECHLSPSTGAVLRGSTDFSRKIEMDRWLTQDKHAIARLRVEPAAVRDARMDLGPLRARIRRQLGAIGGNQAFPIRPSNEGNARRLDPWLGDSNKLSRQICDRLWGAGAVETENGYGKFRRNCLTCHGGYGEGDGGFGYGDDETMQLGIDCLHCHQTGTNPEWIRKHDDDDHPESWRLLAPEQKAEAGFRDLVNVSAQGSLCFDCHIGNRSTAMFVTHDMYEAGHPPLPSIELQQFCEKMPQHWQAPDTLYQSLAADPHRDAYFETNYPGVFQRSGAQRIAWSTRKMLLGALAARKKNLEIFIDSANSNQWWDYSLYDCSSCHHELKVESNRQERGYVGPPGRPRQSEWPSVILSTAFKLDGLATLRESQRLQGQLAACFSRQPFGNPDDVRVAASEFISLIDAVVSRLQRHPMDAATARRVLHDLARTPMGELVTYDAARQVVWSIQAVANDLTLAPEVSRLVRDLGRPEVTGVEAELPAGRRQFIYPDAFAKDLETRAKFDPARLLQRLQVVTEKMSPP